MVYYKCDMHMICMNLCSLTAIRIVVMITAGSVLFSSHKEEKNNILYGK